MEEQATETRLTVDYGKVKGLMRDQERVNAIRSGMYKKSTEFVEHLWHTWDYEKYPEKEQECRKQIENCTDPYSDWVLHSTPPPAECYRIDKEKLGEGGFGYVCKCWSIETGKLYAIKISAKDNYEDLDEKLLNFAGYRSEIELCYFCRDHPHIVHVEEVFEDEENLYFVMELLSGGELSDRLFEERENEIAVPEVVIRKRFQDMVAGVCFIHAQGVVHCDIKPENFVFATEAEDAALKLIDFGFAQVFDWGSKLTDVCGTPHYMAPEVAHEKYGSAADMWSLGCCLFDMIFHFNPFYTRGGMSVTDIIKAVQKGFNPTVRPGYGAWFPESDPVDEDTRDLISKLLTKQVGARPTAEEVLEHTWFQQVDSNEASLSIAVVKSIMHFKDVSPLQKLILSMVLRTGFLTIEEIRRCKETFDIIDVDASGDITVEEFAECARGLADSATLKELNSIFDALDIDGDRTLSIKEFLMARVQHKLSVRPERLKKIFAQFNPDCDSVITPSQLSIILQNNGINLSEPQVNAFILSADENGDGEIEWQEFIALFVKI